MGRNRSIKHYKKPRRTSKTGKKRQIKGGADSDTITTTTTTEQTQQEQSLQQDSSNTGYVWYNPFTWSIFQKTPSNQ